MIDLSDKQRQFIVGLTKLSQETGVAIGGCGCCGSPFLTDAPFTSSASGYAVTPDGENVKWVDPSNSYDWKHYADKVVRPSDQQSPAPESHK